MNQKERDDLKSIKHKARKQQKNNIKQEARSD